MAAKGFADRSDDADFGSGGRSACWRGLGGLTPHPGPLPFEGRGRRDNPPAACGFGFVRRDDRIELKARVKAFQNLVAGYDQFFLPGVTGVERHKLDETHM